MSESSVTGSFAMLRGATDQREACNLLSIDALVEALVVLATEVQDVHRRDARPRDTNCLLAADDNAARVCDEQLTPPILLFTNDTNRDACSSPTTL
ncbi:MAG TPA: hypothetical protein VIP11_02890 [Gemmatimonadaceae bacterium]